MKCIAGLVPHIVRLDVGYQSLSFQSPVAMSSGALHFFLLSRSCPYVVEWEITRKPHGLCYGSDWFVGGMLRELATNDKGHHGEYITKHAIAATGGNMSDLQQFRHSEDKPDKMHKIVTWAAIALILGAVTLYVVESGMLSPRPQQTGQHYPRGL
jgi:hypothetical protein